MASAVPPALSSSANLNLQNQDSAVLIGSLTTTYWIKYDLIRGFEDIDIALSTFPWLSLVETITKVHERTLSDYQWWKNTWSREFLYYAVELRYFMANKFANWFDPDTMIEGIEAKNVFKELWICICRYITEWVGAEINPEKVSDRMRDNIGLMVTLIKVQNSQIEANTYNTQEGRKIFANFAWNYSKFISDCRRNRSLLLEWNDIRIEKD